MIEELAGAMPRIHPECFVHPSAVLGGRITMEKDCSVWYNAVIRGDVGKVYIGPGCNIQDGAIVHVGNGMPGADSKGMGDVYLTENVSLGHGAIVHGCHVGKNVIIGMGAVVLSGAWVGDNCIIAAGAVVRENQEVPSGSMITGVPGTLKRMLTPEEIKEIERTAGHYIGECALMRGLGRGDSLEGLWNGD